MLASLQLELKFNFMFWHEELKLNTKRFVDSVAISMMWNFKIKTKSSLHSWYYAKACNEWRGHLRGLAPELHSAKETSQRWRAVATLCWFDRSGNRTPDLPHRKRALSNWANGSQKFRVFIIIDTNKQKNQLEYTFLLAGPCNSDPCLNGGSCIDLSDTEFTCICPPQFLGAVCDMIDIRGKIIKSSSYSRYYAETCNVWRDQSPRFCAWATQLRRNVIAVARRCRHCVRFDRSECYARNVPRHSLHVSA